ncbi:hypothetical protein Cch01nite_18380 [Cellulomonas chitinilytica]|uniref:Uncharacterized protein n=1 Tax=Cellulomonas chitinilytica TaxID=398759 RepID=A0A919U2H4_9CELL|nr:hypothetical protein [Cellulomonas chitinilytica]GIG21114.1 hypothetical protein Cch01nite_18380 [Cellulomonas chitinilytica]
MHPATTATPERAAPARPDELPVRETTDRPEPDAVTNPEQDGDDGPPVTTRRRVVEAVLLCLAFVYVPLALWRIVEITTRP